MKQPKYKRVKKDFTTEKKFFSMILCFILVAQHSGLVKNNRDKSPQSPNLIFFIDQKAIDMKKFHTHDL